MLDGLENSFVVHRPVSGGEKEYLDYAFKKPKQMLSYMFVTSAVSV